MSDSGSSEVMMPVTKPDALQHIEITVLRQIGENIAAQSRHLETLAGKVDDVRERVIRMEAKETEKHIETLNRKVEDLQGELNTRVSALEARDNRVSGVTAFGAWVAQSAPWLIAGVLAVMAFMGKK